MRQPLCAEPAPLHPLDGIDPGVIPSAKDLNLPSDSCPGRQRGGRSQGVTLLESFCSSAAAVMPRSSPVRSPLLDPAPVSRPI